MSDRGWICIYRKIQNCWLWDKPFSKGQAWIDLLLLANYEDKKILLNGKIVTCERGVVNISILSLAERWGWNRKTVRHFLDLLEADNMVTTEATTKRTTITIVNYSNFQNVGATEGATENPKSGQQRDNRADITNNITNITNNNNKSRGLKQPTLQEVESYCQERGNGISAEHFIDYYGSQKWKKANGQPLTDWKAAVRTWERRDKQQTQVKKEKVKTTTFNNFEQRDYDFAELERKLFNR